MAHTTPAAGVMLYLAIFQPPLNAEEEEPEEMRNTTMEDMVVPLL